MLAQRCWQGCAGAVARAHSRRRLTVLLACYLVVTLLMGWRLVTIQVVDAAQYRGLAAAQTQREVTIAPRRGKLYDRSGEPLALSLTAATIYANPRALQGKDGRPPAPSAEPAFVAAELAPILDRPAADIEAALRKDAGFVYLARQLPRQVGQQVRALRLPGVGVLEEARREYPAGNLASQVVGFAGIDGEGLAGMELGLEDILHGQPGRIRMEQAPRGLEISSAPRDVLPPVPGTDVVLTIDRELQSFTEDSLTRAVKQFNADGGSAVVLDVATGEILAMASLPSASPTERGADPAARRNRVVTDIFEPGSVNKVITAAAALEERVVSADEVFKIPKGYKVGDKVFTDSHTPESNRMSFRDIIAQSSNIGTIKVAERLGPKRLHRYLRQFGYGETTGLRFPGESAGMLHPPGEWSATSLPTISIGQGVSASLLQVANVFGTVARGGEWIQPTLVRGTIDAEGRLRPRGESPRRRVVSQATADTLARMLVGVVEDEEGTCARCAVPGYGVGGKTGTAQKPSTTRRGYEPGAYVGSFAGFAPADDPALVVGVTLDEPRPVYYGGLTAGPTFAEIMGFALTHRRVPPTHPRERATALPAPQPGVPAWAARPAAPRDR